MFTQRGSHETAQTPGHSPCFAMLLAAAALGLACGDSADPRRPAPHPNVTLVVIDSLRADHVHSYGYPRETTPALDRLAREGARFEIAAAPSPWSLPSLVTLFTALPPAQHGVVRPDLALAADALTLAEVLKERGFATAAFVAGPDLEPGRGLAQGFDTYVAHAEGAGNRSAQPLAEFDSWLAGWDAGGRERPFFAFVHLPRPGEGEGEGDNDDAGLPAGFEEMFQPADSKASTAERRTARYDAGVRYADEQLGQLAQRIDALGLREETLLIVTSNHGAELGERGSVGDGRTLYAESVRVPLVVRFPSRLDAGKIVAEPARLMDIGATIMMLARVRQPLEFGFPHKAYGFAMRDLTELLLGEPRGKRVVLAGDLAGASQSLRLGSYKLIRHFAVDDDDDNDDDARDHVRDEFFNVEIDPGETNDLRVPERKRAADYARKLEAWREICAARPQFAVAHRSEEN